MTNYGKSLFYFGIYILFTGLFILFLPNLFLEILKLPPLSSGWARMLGLIVIVIGGYDVVSGYNSIRVCAAASVYLRILFFTGVLLLFLLNEMPKEILPFGIIDLAGAIWTYITLSRSAKSSTALP